MDLRSPPPVVQDGDKFWRMPECYIRGSTIKYLRIPDEIIDMVKEEVVAKGHGHGGLQHQTQQKDSGIGSAGQGVFGAVAEAGSHVAAVSQKRSLTGRQVNSELAVCPPEI